MFSKKIHINPLLYIPLVLALSWTPWWLAVSTGRGLENLAVKVLLLAGLLAPAVVALVFILLGEEAEYHWDYWRRAVDPTLISRVSYRLIFLLPVIITLMATLGSFIFGGSLSQLKIMPQVRAHLPSILVFIFYTFFIGPFPEELGWRGYWLDKLKDRMSGLRASLLIALVWAVWYIPLFLVKGFPLQAKTREPLFLAFYFIELFPKSVILTYLFLKNRRSTLAAILFHFMINFTGQIFELKPLTEGLVAALYLLVAIVLVVRNKEIFK
ncbi:MAG: CPBP family intramembrane metalloprotease [Candidatus Saccharicenans sp.]|jgi:membrane protease YdiL (CAAX protease family)|nr:CPBP family intramembrane metalloprotease [Candidatus Saccharicenans sp.]MDH7492694.1 type II CAAX endopeptidase family protein [Candidatus Saccharicenans sp.]